MPESKKYLNRDGLEEYNSLLPHSSGEMQEYVNDWLDEHPEATTTVQDGAITEPKLADKSVSLRTLADDTVHMLKGIILTQEISGKVLAADDAYSAPLVALTVAGKSTQDGTPTPETPIEIVSLEQVSIHASADGTTDAANWPVRLNLTHALRSLPNGTHDTLSLTYLRPSTREGWAWYSRELVQVAGSVDMGTLSWSRYEATGTFYTSIRDRAYGANGSGMTAIYGSAVKIYSSSQTGDYGDYTMFFYASGTNISVHVKDSRFTVASDYKNAVSGVILYYALATPITTTLDPIELPVLPAPDMTVWADPSTGLTMEYVQDTNIVIASLQAALADLATS